MTSDNNTPKELPVTASTPVAGSAGSSPATTTGQRKRNPKVISFGELYRKESAHLDDRLTDDGGTVLKGVAGEPWVTFTPHDRFGLALSGGGIRSATFNLGLLQALAELRILKLVDYLSTVSGGGYIGAFWTAWLQRRGEANVGDARFPLPDDQGGGERAEIRHLREFSRFLLPRVGLMETEFWGVMMTILGGLVPSLIAALAVLCLCWTVWVRITAELLRDPPLGGLLLAGGLLLYLGISEFLWGRSGKSERNAAARWSYIVASFAAAAAVFLLSSLRPRSGGAASSDAWFGLSPTVFLPAVILAATTLGLLFVRVALARFFHGRHWISKLEGFERTLTRLLGMTASLVALACLWWVASQLGETGKAFARLWGMAAGAATSAALFAWAKKWLTSPVEQTHGSNLLRTALNHLKRATPKLLASLTWLLLFLFVGAAVYAVGAQPEAFTRPGAERLVVVDTWWKLVWASAGVVFMTAWLFDPARVGMHEFYRSRISRCYLGASNCPASGPAAECASVNRYVVERPTDDLRLKDLASVKRPLHLICTAANDMSGDTLSTLYRGARSTVVSRHGISIGDETAELDELRVSSALTASAAAFNSHMGRVSMDLGPAVTFLMSALNLRLGLWVPHPKTRYRTRYTFPGRFFLFELCGRSSAKGRHLHLSDGNHFENFGLYELIRRHVRYIIVSDCGADPEVAFDDLANVLRRVREDFGVEIELDISPLRPDAATGLARQHAVVGTIHYNGPSGMDKGTILFFKPTLTGDEPPDVLQYRTRNRSFPHESTGDQFYDEPQWESYRRLGEHAARTVLGFFERADAKMSSEVDKLFRDARAQWHPGPERHHESFLELTQRWVNLEADLLATGPVHLRAEVFPEAAELGGLQTSPPTGEDEIATFSFLLRMTQIMEDVWLAADLERHWSHPLNEGWMSHLNRWASTPSFRRWWPIFAPIYSLGFREFTKGRFGVGVQDKAARPSSERSIAAGQLTLKLVSDRETFMASRTWQLFQQRHARFEIPPDARLFGYELELLGYDGRPSGKNLLVGFTIVSETEDERGLWTATWRSTEFYIPRSLHGTGKLARMLDALIQTYQKGGPADPRRKFVRLAVQFAAREQETSSAPRQKAKVTSQATRHQRVQEIQFYKSRGFQYAKPEDAETGEITLTRALGA